MKNLLLAILYAISFLSCDSQKTPEAADQSAPTLQSHEGHRHEAPAMQPDPATHPDEDTARIRLLITALSKTYGEPADSIAERTYRARYVLNDFGIEESAVQILEAMSKAGRKEQKTYREAVLQYTMQRTQGAQ